MGERRTCVAARSRRARRSTPSGSRAEVTTGGEAPKDVRMGRDDARGWRVCLRCFFFQAEDGIRDVAVTGVQTCALPISDDVIQFDGMTIGGSSGSPLFNANGEVIAIHRAGLAQAPGFAISVPIRHAVAIMPIPLRHKLGIE